MKAYHYRYGSERTVDRRFPPLSLAAGYDACESRTDDDLDNEINRSPFPKCPSAGQSED